MVIKKDAHSDVSPVRDSEEIKIVEFCVGEKFYGVDVMQIREILRASTGIVPVAGTHPSVCGVINLRGKIIPVINLAFHLNIPVTYDPLQSRIIVSEFNHVRVGFWVHRVTKIHRMFKSAIDLPSDLVQSRGYYISGATRLEDRILFLLDFARITRDIHPEDDLPEAKPVSLPIPRADFDRSTKKILVVEDSAFIRKLVARYARDAGYNIAAVANGQEAWQVLEETVRSPGFQDISLHYHLVVTDLEMPVMDGIGLIRKMRAHPLLQKLPCIVFSAFLTEERIRQCQAAGADAEIAKDDVERLISLIDSKVTRS